MTSHSPLFRFLCTRPSAWLSLYLAISPAAISEHPPKADAKPIAHFTDVAAKPGLTTPAVFGPENPKKSIIATTSTTYPTFHASTNACPHLSIATPTNPHP